MILFEGTYTVLVVNNSDGDGPDDNLANTRWCPLALALYLKWKWSGGREWCFCSYLSLNNSGLRKTMKPRVRIFSSLIALGPVSLRLMTSQFKDIVTHTQKYMTVKCTFYGVWVQNFVWNFKGALWNFTQSFEPIHRKICILWGGKHLTTYDILELWHLKS